MIWYSLQPLPIMLNEFFSNSNSDKNEWSFFIYLWQNFNVVPGQKKLLKIPQELNLFRDAHELIVVEIQFRKTLNGAKLCRDHSWLWLTLRQVRFLSLRQQTNKGCDSSSPDRKAHSRSVTYDFHVLMAPSWILLSHVFGTTVKDFSVT